MTEKIKMIFWGIIAALGALVLESLVIIIATSTNTTDFSIDSPWFMPAGVFIEEFISLLLIGKLFQNSAIRNGFFVQALFFGVGFAFPEVLLNIVKYPVLSQAFLLSYLGLILLHTATAGIFGYYFSRKETFRFDIIFFFLLAFLAHLAFNLFVLSSLSYWLILGLPSLVLSACFLALKASFSKNSLPIGKI